MDFILGFLTAVVLQYILNRVYMKLFEKRAQGIIDETMRKLKDTIVPARIEVNQGVLYMYHRDTNEFLAQGNTFKDLEEAARSKYPNKLFNVPQDNLNSIGDDNGNH